jgi:ubiquinone/menaquinone biosynthesis C-methylase UbiE
MPAPPLTPLAAAVLHAGAPERILQVECGEGEAALFLAREFPSARVRGVDRSEEAIRRATSRIGLDPEGRVAFKVGAPGSLPFPDDHFDLAALLDSRPRPGELARVLRPGGFLVVARSEGLEPWAGALGWMLRKRISGRGFETIWADSAGDGSFSVARLRRGAGLAGAL